MRTLQFVLALVTIVVLGAHWPSGPLAPARAETRSAGESAANPPVLSGTRAGTAGDHRGSDLEYVPRQIGNDSDNPSGVGTLLIICAVVVLGVIVGFVIRHHRSGRAG